MEFLKLVRRRTFVSEFIYLALNVALAVAVTLVVYYTQSIWLALLIVVISKWRVFAVRPRYWWANLRSNLVDFIVSFSVVIHLSIIEAVGFSPLVTIIMMSLLTILYIAWLIFLKPRSSRHMVALQAGAAVLLGTAALFSVSFSWSASLVVIGMWLIGYTAARHALSSYDDETHGLFLSLAWGVVFAELGWIAYHWTIAYPLPLIPSLQFPQVAVVATLVSFVAFKAYDSFYHHSKVRSSDIILPLLFSLSIIIVLLVLFNRVGTAI